MRLWDAITCVWHTIYEAIAGVWDGIVRMLGPRLIGAALVVAGLTLMVLAIGTIPGG